MRSVVILWQYYHDIERLLQAFPRLDASAIEGALAYYEAHRTELDQLTEENERAAYSAD